MPADVCDVAKEAIQSKFHLPLSVASTQLGVSQSYLKRLCRTHGIPRWPFRQVSRAQHADPRHKLTVALRIPSAYRTCTDEHVAAGKGPFESTTKERPATEAEEHQTGEHPSHIRAPLTPTYCSGKHEALHRARSAY